MEHKAYRRINDHADIAILFIHGIVGTPNHFNEFVSLVPETISVYNLLLDGHGKGTKDFSNTSMKKWEAQVTSAVEDLAATHEKILIVAHSLGTLLAIEQAVKNEKVCKLFLLAVPLSISLKLKAPINSLKVYFGRIHPDDYEALAAQKCYGIEMDKNPLHYVGWIPRFLELFVKIRQTRKLAKLIHTNCVIYQSQKDEMVSWRSVKYLQGNPSILINSLEKSGHYYYEKDDFEFLITEFKKLIKKETEFQ